MSFWSWLSGESESQSRHVQVPGGRYIGQTEIDRAIQSAFGREHGLYRKDWLGRIRTMDGRTYKLHQNSDGSYTAEEI